MTTRDIAILAIIAIFFVSWICFQASANPKTGTDITFALFTTSLGAGFTVFVLDRLRKRDDQERMKPLEKVVRNIISDELNTIYLEFAWALIPHKNIQATGYEDHVAKSKAYRLEEMAKLVEASDDQINDSLRQINLRNQYNNTNFELRQADLSVLISKYGMLFKDTDILAPLANLETNIGKLNRVVAHIKTTFGNAAAMQARVTTAESRKDIKEILKSFLELKRLKLITD